MKPTPANKANALVDMIQKVTDLRRPPELELRRIYSEAMTLVRAGVAPADGHMVAGIVECMSFRTEEFQRHFDIAFTLSPSRHIRMNYINAATRLGLIARPLSCAREILAAYPDDISMLNAVHEMAARALDFDLMDHADLSLEKLNAQRSDQYYLSAQMHLMRDQARKLGISSEDIIARLEVAGEVLRSATEPIFAFGFGFDEEGRASYQLGIGADLDTIFDLNYQIVDRLVDSFDNTLADLFTICCLLERRELHSNRLSFSSDQAQH